MTPEPDFELDGFNWGVHTAALEDVTRTDSKVVTDAITPDTGTGDLSSILKRLPSTISYEQDGYTGSLHLDMGSIATSLDSRDYVVVEVRKILATDWSWLEPTADHRITLITCIANEPAYRLMVQAVQEVR